MGGGICLLLTTRVVEASVGHSWETEGEGMVPQVSPLVQAFLTAMGRSVSPSSVRECWPSKNNIIPRQPMNPLRACITHCLDKGATRKPFYHCMGHVCMARIE